jgi:hypothetical protein
LPALLFTAFSLYSGMYQQVVDNAAHVGGFVTGLMLGGVFARRFGQQDGFPAKSLAIAAALISVCAIGPLWYIGAFGHRPSAFDQFAATHRWYVDRETPNLLLWQTLSARAATNAISSDEIKDRFSREFCRFGKTPTRA